MARPLDQRPAAFLEIASSVVDALNTALGMIEQRFGNVGHDPKLVAHDGVGAPAKVVKAPVVDATAFIKLGL